MSMRRGITYILLAANWVIVIGCAVCLYLFFKNRDGNANNFVKTMHLAIIAPVVVDIISSVLLFLYSFLLKKSLKDHIHNMNPKLLSLIKSTSYISIINLILPLIFSITALSIVSSNNVDKNITLVLLIVSFAISILIGLFVTGYTSYINFRISFNEEKRKALLENYEPEMKMYKDKIDYKDEKTAKKYEKKEEIDDSLATSGSFHD